MCSILIPPNNKYIGVSFFLLLLEVNAEGRGCQQHLKLKKIIKSNISSSFSLLLTAKKQQRIDVDKKEVIRVLLVHRTIYVLEKALVCSCFVEVLNVEIVLLDQEFLLLTFVLSSNISLCMYYVHSLL